MHGGWWRMRVWEPQSVGDGGWGMGAGEPSLTPTPPPPPLLPRLDSIHTPLAPRPAPPPPAVPGIDLLLRSYIPGAVLSRLVAEQTTWLAELRRVTVIFVNLPIGDLSARLEHAQ